MQHFILTEQQQEIYSGRESSKHCNIRKYKQIEKENLNWKKHQTTFNWKDVGCQDS